MVAPGLGAQGRSAPPASPAAPADPFRVSMRGQRRARGCGDLAAGLLDVGGHPAGLPMPLPTPLPGSSPPCARARSHACVRARAHRRRNLEASFDEVVEVRGIDSKDAANLALLKRPELGITFTKIAAWTLCKYTKCVFLDADTLVLTNVDELFDRQVLGCADVNRRLLVSSAATRSAVAQPL